MHMLFILHHIHTDTPENKTLWLTNKVISTAYTELTAYAVYTVYPPPLSPSPHQRNRQTQIHSDSLIVISTAHTDLHQLHIMLHMLFTLHSSLPNPTHTRERQTQTHSDSLIVIITVCDWILLPNSNASCNLFCFNSLFFRTIIYIPFLHVYLYCHVYDVPL